MNAGIEPKLGSIELNKGWHAIELQWIQAYRGFFTYLEVKAPDSDEFRVIPKELLRTEQHTLVTSPGRKAWLDPFSSSSPGCGLPLTQTHPDWTLKDISLDGFAPKVGGIGSMSNGDLIVASFTPNNAAINIQEYDPKTTVYRISNYQDKPKVTAIAGHGVNDETFSEATGLCVVNDQIFVALRENIYRLIDGNKDGLYEKKEAIMKDGWAFDNFHQFPFGLITKKDGDITYIHGCLSVAIYHGGASAPNRHTHSGCAFKVAIPEKGKRSTAIYYAGGFRTPNGVSEGPENSIIIADNQGSWNPASSLTIVKSGLFYGHYNPTKEYRPERGGNHDGEAFQGKPNAFQHLKPTPKNIWLPQNEAANSPTQGIMLKNGIFSGQMLMGELTRGGLRRIYFDKVNGAYQGCVFRHSQGFEAGVNRLYQLGNGSIAVGCIGAPGNWSWRGKRSGLQLLTPSPTEATTFEMHSVRAIKGGLQIRFTQPVAEQVAISDFSFQQYGYLPTAAYGGSKLNREVLQPEKLTRSADGKTITLHISTLKNNRVVHLITKLRSAANQPLWSGDCWYTMNQLPR